MAGQVAEIERPNQVLQWNIKKSVDDKIKQIEYNWQYRWFMCWGYQPDHLQLGARKVKVAKLET